MEHFNKPAAMSAGHKEARYLELRAQLSQLNFSNHFGIE
jgi:hypothetical protein